MRYTSKGARKTKEDTKKRQKKEPIADLPNAGFVRLGTILRVFPVGRSSWWKGIAEGRYPTGVKLAPRTTAWNVSSIRALIDQIGNAAPGQ